MWKNPKYAQAAPPHHADQQELSVPLATLARGPGEELRVTLDSYNGHPFAQIRLWVQGNDGAWYATRKGTSVRCRELAQVATALMRALDLVQGPSRASTNGRPTSAGIGSARKKSGPQTSSSASRGIGYDGHQAPLPLTGVEFSEFD